MQLLIIWPELKQTILCLIVRLMCFDIALNKDYRCQSK